MEEKHCKWYNDEFCTNGDSPCVADFCPVVEYPDLCKHREIVKDISVRSKTEDKKLTDETTIDSLKADYYILKERYVKVLGLNEKVIADQNAEIERLTEKVENQKAVIKGQNKAIEKEKSENKRLYDEYVRLDDFCAGKGCLCCICECKETCNECAKCGSLKTEKCKGFRIDVSKYARAIERADKLQKQVGELKSENTELHKEHTTLIAGSILEKQDIAKYTAKEILQELYDQIDENTPKWVGVQIKIIAKRKGVEVE